MEQTWKPSALLAAQYSTHGVTHRMQGEVADRCSDAAYCYSQAQARTTVMISLTCRLSTAFLSSTAGDTIQATKNKLVLNYLRRK